MPEVRRPFKMELPEKLLRIATAFDDAGYELYVVGGAVRDAVMGTQPHDFDLATNATPVQVMEVMHGMSSWKADETGKSFGVIRAIHLEMKELCEYEIATFREDMTAGRHPEVRFATIVEDVQRRDLTINALFYDVKREEIVDLVGGLQDIEARYIRAVGRPEDRFAEDRLRIMRAFRFAARFDYLLDMTTEDAIRRDNSLEGISPERVRDEFVRSLASAKSTNTLLNALDDFAMWRHVLPGLEVSNRKIYSSRSVPVVLALLLMLNPAELIARRLIELKYTAHEAAQVCFLLRFRARFDGHAYELRKAFQRSGLTVEHLLEFEQEWPRHDSVSLPAFIRYISHTPVKGDDLLAEGYSGKALGMELER